MPCSENVLPRTDGSDVVVPSVTPRFVWSPGGPGEGLNHEQ